MSKHIHAEHMLQYAQDAMETDKPWELWRVRRCYIEGSVFVYGDWRDCTPSDMTFHDDYEYRRKPRVININGHEVPEPVRKPLERGDKYFIPDIKYDELCDYHHWKGVDYDQHRLESGLLHLTKEAAITHAKALLSFTTKPEVSGE